MGERKIIAAENAPKAVGPYSQAVQMGDFLFVSGQLPFDMATGELSKGNIREMAKCSLKNIDEIAKAAGASIGDSVKVTVYLTDMGDFDDINEVFKDFFPNDPPARACVAVSALPRGARLEIDAIIAIES